MRLSCNLITNNGPGTPSVFYMAGSAIPDELVPDHAKQYRISEREGRELEKELLEWKAMVASAKRRKSERRQRSVGRRVPARIRPLISYCPIGLGKLGKRIVETEAICSRCGNISTATSKP